MKRPSRLARREDVREETQPARLGTHADLEFASAEDALRRDRHEIAVPPGVAERLESAISDSGSSVPRRWWQRLFHR
jgi:hypothetical protein